MSAHGKQDVTGQTDVHANSKRRFELIYPLKQYLDFVTMRRNWNVCGASKVLDSMNIMEGEGRRGEGGGE